MAEGTPDSGIERRETCEKAKLLLEVAITWVRISESAGNMNNASPYPAGWKLDFGWKLLPTMNSVAKTFSFGLERKEKQNKRRASSPCLSPQVPVKVPYRYRKVKWFICGFEF
jgi:hypothetical protein